ncbi:MAG: hypothetical protein MZW92_69760 [Comamonadaceae bacterium]|nr:hypothetical protein [Comamonadaceae bacterium]
MPAWQKLGVDGRTGVCLEILGAAEQGELRDRLRGDAHHRPGLRLMAFQAGGPHAQDRGLEAVAYAYREMSFVPREAHWEKPQGKNPPLVMEKRFEVVGRGVGAGDRLLRPSRPGTPTRACSRRSPPATP